MAKDTGEKITVKQERPVIGKTGIIGSPQARLSLKLKTNTGTPLQSSGWPHGEIKLGQEESYAEWLREVIHDRNIVASHLMESSIHDLERKFSIICKVMQETENGLDFHIPGPKSCLIAATAHKSIKVMKIILSLATPMQLMVKTDSYPGYEGCTGLHVIIANELDDILPQYMEKLDRVDRLVMINTHLEGDEFLKRMKTSSLPLHLACWSGNPTIFEQLIQYGAELDARDVNGNTVLHVLVELSNSHSPLAQQMFETVLTSDASRKWFCLKTKKDPNHWTAQDDIELKQHMLYIENNEGYTPLTWAAKYQNRNMIEFIFNIEGVYRQTAWQFGRSCFVSYDMSEVDQIISERIRPGKPNVIELLTYSSVSQKVLPCFSIPVIKQLIAYKWNYNFIIFFIWAAVHLTMMIICYLIPVTIIQDLRDPINTLTNTSEMLHGRLTAIDLLKNSSTLQILHGYVAFHLSANGIVEAATWGKSFLHFIMMLTRGRHGQFYKPPLAVILKSDLYRVVFDIFIICQSLSMFYLLTQSVITSYTAFAFISGCYSLMFFLQGLQTTSYFGTLMHMVIFTDMISFAFVFAIMLVGFGGTMMMVTYDPLHPVFGYESLQAATYSMFQLMTGLGSVDRMTDVKNIHIVTAVFILFVCLTVILLLNMLIAAMSESYSNLAPYRQEIWTRNRASIMIRFEYYSMIVALKVKTGNYLRHDLDYDKYSLLVETSVPATCLRAVSSVCSIDS